ncbi:MAG: metallopeptidase TldD-related protein [Thermoanaerobaculia bacterium]
MSLAGLPTSAIANLLAQIAEGPGDWVDAYFERLEEVTLAPDAAGAGWLSRREEGLAVRLLRGERCYLACRDEITGRALAQAARQVARAMPTAQAAEPRIAAVGPREAPGTEEMAAFPGELADEIRRRHVAFPYLLSLSRHQRDVQVVGTQLVPEAERERFYSLAVELPWGRYGTLLPELGAAAVGMVASALVARFRARQAAPPAPGHKKLVLAPAAAAVLVHEAVAHALEADVLAASGNPARAVGLALGPAELSVLDDPGSAPGETRRTTDDEGMAVCRRWLLRAGVVEQPLADLAFARASATLLPGAGRRGRRDLPPAPRCSHLEVIAGTLSEPALRERAEGGYWISEVDRGRLDPRSGRFELAVPFARRVVAGELTETVGPFRLRSSVANLLGAVVGVGMHPQPAGAGWCAKGGSRLPVWATTPALLLAGIEVQA